MLSKVRQLSCGSGWGGWNSFTKSTKLWARMVPLGSYCISYCDNYMDHAIILPTSSSFCSTLMIGQLVQLVIL